MTSGSSVCGSCKGPLKVRPKPNHDFGDPLRYGTSTCFGARPLEMAQSSPCVQPATTLRASHSFRQSINFSVSCVAMCTLSWRIKPVLSRGWSGDADVRLAEWRSNHAARTITGMLLDNVVLLPSWPALLSPQHLTVPSFRQAQACQSPAAISATPETAGTPIGTGMSESAVVPSPSCESGAGAHERHTDERAGPGNRRPVQLRADGIERRPLLGY